MGNQEEDMETRNLDCQGEGKRAVSEGETSHGVWRFWSKLGVA